MFYLVYIPETDADPKIAAFELKATLENRVKQWGLHPYDYAIFEGNCLKPFEANHLALKSKKRK